MRMRTDRRLVAALLPVIGAVGFMLGVSGSAQSQANTAIPCAAKAKAVIANTGQSIHNASSTVQGDVQAALTIVQQGGAIITGTKTQNTPAGLAVVPIPAGATNLGTFVLGSGQSRNLVAGNYRATSFTMNSNSTLTVSGGIVQIWVTGALVIGGRANNGGVPENLEFLVNSTQNAHVNSGATLFGFIYAPTAPVLIDSVVHGSIVGSATTINSGGQVIFDPGSTCPPPCPTGQTLCSGVCVDTQSNTSDCGACGNVCPTGDSCIAGVCTAQGSCAPANSLTTLVTGPKVTAFVPNGSWSETGAANTGVKVAIIEGTGASTIISTPNPVNSCAGNSATGQVVCTSNLTDVYLISGSTLSLTNTLTSGATASQNFSGGTCETCGVTVDTVHNQAAVTIGSATGGAFQLLNLATSTFGTIIPAGTGVQTSEDILIDPGRNLILSPNETNDYVLASTSAPNTVFNFSPAGGPPSGEFDSAAEDCSTGIALSSVEFTGSLFLTNLAHATFTGSTWTAPSQYQTFPEFASFSAGTDGIAVDSGTHLGIVSGEFGGSGFGAIQLPTSGTTGVPAATDWAAANVPSDPNNVPWAAGLDPHTITVYRSPTTNKAFGVMQNGPRTFLAIIDLQALLAAPRVAGTHNVQPTFDLVANGVLRFVGLP